MTSDLKYAQPGPEIGIFPASEEDAPAIHDLQVVCAPDCIPMPTSEIACRRREFFLIRNGRGGVAAAAALRPLDRWRLELRGVAVSPSMQGEGLGSRLVAASLGYAWRRMRQVVLVTRRPQFFARLGFHKIPLNWIPEKPERSADEQGADRVAMSWIPGMADTAEDRRS